MRASSDRISALRRMPVTDLAALLGRVPALAESLDGVGPLAPASDGGPTLTRTDRTLTHLGVLMASPRGVTSVIAALNRLERQLLVLAALHDGAIQRETAVAEAGDHRALDQAASALAQLLLAHQPYSDEAWLVLRPGVVRYVPVPGVRIYDALQTLSGSDLDLLLQRWGVEELPYRHEDRRRLVGGLLRRRGFVAELMAQLDPEAQGILRLLIEHGVQRVGDLGLPPFDPWDRRGGPLHEVVQSGLAGVDTAKQRAFAWVDVAYGFRQRLYDDWPVNPPAVDPAPLFDPGPRTPPVIRRLQQLLELWSTEPAPSLANGGIGVRVVRAAAKGFGMDEGEVGLLVHLAIDLGLLGETDEGDWAPTPALAAFVALQPARQWAAVVAAWRQATTVDEHAGLPNRWDGEIIWPDPTGNRSAVLDVLTTLDEGTGVDRDTLIELCGWRYPESLGPAGADAIITALRVLDLVPATGPVGLTTAARALLDGGVTAAATALGPVVDTFVVQADHTVIAAPGLDPRIAGTLAAIAELESDAGAQIWRITPAKVGEALADGRTRDELVGFLTDTSTVPPPSNVLVTIDDVAARHGRLRAGVVGCYLRCDDAAALAGAAAVSAAKLRVIAPTVAVSPLGRDVMIRALRARGVIAAAEDADGVLLPPRRTRGTPLEGTGLPAAAERPTLDVLALAEELQGAEGATRP